VKILPSLVYRVTRCVKANTVPEMSDKSREAQGVPSGRDEAKKMGKEDDHIYSYGEMKRTLETAQRLTRFAKENYDINEIGDLTKKISNDYLRDKRDYGNDGKGCKSSYLAQEKSKINKFEKCLEWTGDKAKDDESIVPDIYIPEYNRSDNAYGHYTDEEADILLNDIKEHSTAAHKVLEFQKETGFRIHEAMNFKESDVDFENNEVKIRRGKGGKSRIVKITDEYADKLKKIIDNKDDNSNYVFNDTKKRNVQKQIGNACDRKNIDRRGTHGMRGNSVYNMMKEKGYSDKDIEKIINKREVDLTDKEKDDLLDLANHLGHNRIRIVRRHYLQR